MFTKWEEIYSLLENRTIIRQQFDGIETFSGYFCLVAYWGSFIKGYLPPSELGSDEPTEELLNLLLSYPIPVVIKKVLRDQNIIVLSRRTAITRLEDRFWESARPGRVMEGTILTLAQPGKGLEVDLGGVIAEVPPGEVTWLNWIEPRELRRQLPLYGTVRLKITALNKAANKVTASIKGMQDDPWGSLIPSRYAPGTIHRGVATGQSHTGVFVKFSDGVTCLVDKKTFASYRIPIETGIPVNVRIRSIDLVRRRINGKVVKMPEIASIR